MKMHSDNLAIETDCTAGIPLVSKYSQEPVEAELFVQ
jgi:hypothetical protein